jgi:hypothetical protein
LALGDDNVGVVEKIGDALFLAPAAERIRVGHDYVLLGMAWRGSIASP